jgi:hypothetical protein
MCLIDLIYVRELLMAWYKLNVAINPKEQPLRLIERNFEKCLCVIVPNDL